MSPRPPDTAPTARSWTSMFPSAVASTGPATTGMPVASAVDWHSRAFFDPPPTMWIVAGATPDSSAASRSARL